MKYKLSNLFATIHFGLIFGLLSIFVFWQYSTIKEFHNIQLDNFFKQTHNVVNILIANKHNEVKNIIVSHLKEYSNKESNSLIELEDLDFMFSTKNSKIQNIYGYSLLFDIRKIASKLKDIKDLTKITRIDVEDKPFYIIAHKEQMIDKKIGKVKGELWGVIILNNNQTLINFIKENAKIEEVVFLNQNKNLILSTLPNNIAKRYISNSTQNKISISNNEKYIYQEKQFFKDLNIIYFIDNSLYNNIFEKFISQLSMMVLIILILGIVLYYFIRFKFIKKLTELKYFIENNITNKESKYKPSNIEELDEIAFGFDKLFEDYKLEKERFDLATQSMKDGLWDWDAVTNKVFFSKIWKLMLGYKESEIKDDFNEWKSRVHPADLDKALFAINTHLEKKSDVYENVHRMKHKDGTWIWIYARGKALFDENNKPYRVIGFNTDITLQKEKEKEEKEKDLLLFEQSKMASMGEMIGNIAHQWRQPLSVISTASTGIILQKEYGLIDDNKLIETCNTINYNAQYLSKTIDDFKNFIKGDRNKKVFNLKDNIDSFLLLVEGSVKTHNIDIIKDVQDDIKIDGYENELMQCLINIFNNAKDALNENIITDHKLICITTTQDSTNVYIKIKDNAGGILNEILPKIFEPYFTTKHKSQGTGLGLHMTYKLIVEGMNGTIEANNISYEYQNKNYTGAEFIITLPIVIIKQ